MEYQFVTINYMSGTGNSYRVAVWMKDAARDRGIGSQLQQITRRHDKMDASNQQGTLIGFVFPTYGFCAPWLVIRHAVKLPRGKGQHAFVAATKGALMMDSVPLRGFEGTAVYLIVLILLLKGYRIRGAMGLDMPANMLNVHSGLSETDSRIIIDRARGKVDAFTSRIFGGGKALWGIPDFLLGLALLPLSFIYMGFVRFFLAKLFFASDTCTGCGLCAKSCPQKAIRMVGRRKRRPYWKLTCESCMRCMGYCPNRAIEASHLFAVVLIILITIPIPSQNLHVLSNCLGIDAAYSIVNTIINYLCYLFTISFSYVLFWSLCKIPLFNKFVTVVTLTHFYNRYHEPDTELKDLDAK